MRAGREPPVPVAAAPGEAILPRLRRFRLDIPGPALHQGRTDSIHRPRVIGGRRLDRDGMDGASDEELMSRIAAGDEPAFRVISRRYAARALRLARRILGNEADAEEVVQEALLRLWVNAPRWRPAAAFRTWFYRVVVNLCLNRKRRAPFAAIDDVDEPADPGLDPMAQLEARQSERLVAAAIAALPERQRAAIVLTYQEGLANVETAAVLGTTVSGVETLLVRARRSLRKTLDKD